jgi:DDE superfamily endonuclease
VIEVKAIACELPATRALPLGRWSLAELRQEVITTGLIDQVSVSTLWLWLDEDALKPWRHRSRIFPRDPDFAAKAGVVLDLYAHRFQGRRLEPGEFVVSADEKTSIQARCRCHRTLPPAAARAMRVEHEYERGGALAYLAAWDVHQARLFGRLEPTTGIAPFGRLVAQVMSCEPYASARRVFWIVDNGSSHRGQASIDRLEGGWENLTLVHLPVHASWLNQIEIYFSIVQRKVLTPNDFTDLAEVTQRLLGFQHRYEQTAVPFDWRFTRADLDLLRRLDDIEQFANAAGRSPKNFQKEHLGWDVEVQRTASAHGIRHVEDTVDALLGLLDEPSTIGGTFNIGRPRRSPSATSRAASWSAPAAAPRWSRCRTAKPTGVEDMRGGCPIPPGSLPAPDGGRVQRSTTS